MKNLCLLFLFYMYSCSKTETHPVEIKLTGCDSIKNGILKPNLQDTLRLLSCIKISGCDSIKNGIFKPTLQDTLRLMSCIKISGCDSIRLGILNPSTKDTSRLLSCIKISGCDSLRLGILNPNRKDTLRLLSCIKISGCDSLRIGLLNPSIKDTLRLLSCIKVSGCDSLRLGILEPTKLNSERLNCLIVGIGQRYQGGLIAYILQPGDAGFDVNVKHGLIAAPSDQSTGTKWSLSFTTVGAGDREIGTGLSNTIKIIKNVNETSTTPWLPYAAKIAKDYTGGGYTDWYLPSAEELNKLYINKIMKSGTYWSSSERQGSNAWIQAWYQNFDNGEQGPINKVNVAFGVRAIRSF